MSELFIAPEGAMQFEITVHPKPECVGSRLWVKLHDKGPHHLTRDKVGCSCKVFYQVVHCDRSWLWDGGYTVTCVCFGRIIE